MVISRDHEGKDFFFGWVPRKKYGTSKDRTAILAAHKRGSTEKLYPGAHVVRPGGE